MDAKQLSPKARNKTTIEQLLQPQPCQLSQKTLHSKNQTSNSKSDLQQEKSKPAAADPQNRKLSMKNVRVNI
jgi:hypothetical protein